MGTKCLSLLMEYIDCESSGKKKFILEINVQLCSNCVLKYNIVTLLLLYINILNINEFVIPQFINL